MGKIESLFQQIMEGQKKFAGEINLKVDNMYNDLNGRLESLGAHVRILETEVARSAEWLRNYEGLSQGSLKPTQKNI